MKTAIAWKLEGELAAYVRRHELRTLTSVAWRISLATLSVGFSFWFAALWLIEIPLPQCVTAFGPWAIVGFAAIWWLFLLSVFQRKTYRVYDRGAVTKDRIHPWSFFLGYSIEPHPLSNQHVVLRLWNRNRSRRTDLPLPNDERTQRLILRYVKRFVPPLAQHEDADTIREDLPLMPAWFSWSLLPLGLGYGIAIGWFVEHLHRQGVIPGDWLMLMTFAGGWLHPGWLVAWFVARRSQYQRIRAQLYAMAVGIGFLAWLTAIVALVIQAFRHL